MEGEQYKNCRLTMVGKPACAVLYSREINGDRWRVVDRLTQAEVVEKPDGTMVITGISDELVGIVRVKRSEATVTWLVEPRGCSNC